MSRSVDTLDTDVTDSMYNIRIFMLGGNYVGKTSLLQRYTEGSFPFKTIATIGLDHRVYYQEVEPGVTVRLHVFDTPGHERFRSSTRSYLRGVKGIMLVLDLSDRSSVYHAEFLHRDICDMGDLDTVPFVLVGNKCDHYKREVNRYEAETLASQINASYFEVSAKTGYNVAEVFELLPRRIYQRLLSSYEPSEKWDNDTSAQSYKNKTCIVF